MKKIIFIASLCNAFVVSAMIFQSSNSSSSNNVCVYPTIIYGQVLQPGSNHFDSAIGSLDSHIGLVYNEQHKAMSKLQKAKLLLSLDELNAQDFSVQDTTVHHEFTPDAACDENQESLSSNIDTAIDMQAMKDAKKAAKKERLAQEKKAQASAAILTSHAQTLTTQKAPSVQDQVAVVTTLTKAQAKKLKQEKELQAQKEADIARREQQRLASKKAVVSSNVKPAIAKAALKSALDIQAEEDLLNAAIQESATQAKALKEAHELKVLLKSAHAKEAEDAQEIENQKKIDISKTIMISTVLHIMNLVVDKKISLLKIAKTAKKFIIDEALGQFISVSEVLNMPQIKERYKIFPMQLFERMNELTQLENKEDEAIVMAFISMFSPRNVLKRETVETITVEALNEENTSV